jgi:hypothetical protein
MPKDRATSTLKAMEAQYAHMKRSFGLPAKDWVEKVSLYVFSSRNDFIEFVRTVEGRDVEPEEATSAKLAVPQPYLAAVDPSGGKKEEPAPKSRARGKRSNAEEPRDAMVADRTLPGLLSEALGSGVVASSGNAPRWLREGIGAYLASRLEPRSPYYRQLRQTALASCQQGWQSKANEALGASDQITAADLRAIGFALVECMMTTELGHRFPAFLHAMLDGQGNLDVALKNVYGAARDEFLADSGEWVSARYGASQ